MQSHTLNTLRRRVAPLAVFAIVLSTAWVVFAHAQTLGTASSQPPTATPEALFQDSTLTATTSTINGTFLPVVTSTGKIIYDDIVIQFDVADDGTLTVSAGYPKVTPSPIPINNHFKAGNYIGPDDSTEFITVTGPGVTYGGATEWSIAPTAGYFGCLLPYNASWYDVGKDIKSNPLYTRLEKAGIKSTQYYQFGTGSARVNGGCQGTYWQTNSLLGFAQTSGTTLVIYTFSANGDQDQNTPLDMKTYTYCNGKNGCKQTR